MTWFPFNYRDIVAFADEGLTFSTASNEALKLYDSALTQMTFSNVDPLHGNLQETFAKMLHSDPDFVMGQTMIYVLQAFEKCPWKNPQLVYDVNDFVVKTSKRSKFENHLKIFPKKNREMESDNFLKMFLSI